jgi:hypothetical protein
MLVIVILGISLSTLHQSSLGTLFLATPFRLHPLWYTDLLPLLFFISSIGVGCLTISLVTLVVHWLHRREPPMEAIAGLGRIAAILLGLYLVLRFGEILVSGEAGLLVAPGLDTLNFWLETLLSAALPLAFLLSPRRRSSPRAMFWIALCASVGFTLNRVNVAGLATLSLTHAVYWPAWTEWAMTGGVLGAAGLIYLFAVEHVRLFEGLGYRSDTAARPRPALDPADSRAVFFAGSPLAGLSFYSFTFILAAALALGLLPEASVHGVTPEPVPVERPRTVFVTRTAVDGTDLERLSLLDPADEPGPEVISALLLDGNRDGRDVIFDHAAHLTRAEGPDPVCHWCHHMNRPLDVATSCAECHRDMYEPVDIFDHDLHETRLGGNDGCARCHRDPARRRVREVTTPCTDCHKQLRARVSRIEPAHDDGTMAVGYLDAMHGLCVECHRSAEERQTELAGQLTTCVRCHATMPRTPPELEVRPE